MSRCTPVSAGLDRLRVLRVRRRLCAFAQVPLCICLPLDYRGVMPITVGELLEMPHLQMRLHSGGAAINREVSWTHTTDLPEPWHWIAGGELLMTNGMSLPRSAAAQEELIVLLANHGAAALAIGEQMYSPPLTRRLAQVSDRLGLPVLWIAFPMPFVAISRAVAEATLLEQSQRLIRTERIYRALQRVSAEAAGLKELTSALARELGCPVRVCDRLTGEDWYPGEEALPVEVRQTVRDRRGRLRAGVIAAPLDGDRRALIVDVPTHSDATLVALPDPKEQPDALLLQHAATVCALALSQARLQIEYQRRSGAELLAQILDGQLAPQAAQRQLLEAGIQVEDAVCAVSRNSEDPEILRALHLNLWRAEVTHVTVHRAGLSVTLMRADKASLDSVVRATGENGKVGISNTIGVSGRILDAEREARWALGIASQRGTSLASYEEATPWLGPRTPDEARLLIDRVLGGVLQLPAAQAAEMMTTLRAFLANGQSWQRTAEGLHVHRQTVLYRIRKIEALTGRKLADTSDLATLWLALEAMSLLEPA